MSLTQSRHVDPDFLALPLAEVSDAAIQTGLSLGASHVDIRVERVRTGILQLRDTNPETQTDGSVSGIGVRVIVNGAWGFASAPEISAEKARELAKVAVAMAKTSGPLSTEEIALAPVLQTDFGGPSSIIIIASTPTIGVVLGAQSSAYRTILTPYFPNRLFVLFTILSIR